MDPLTAFSLAGTIVQFIDFGTKLFSQGYQLYKAKNGQLAADQELELVTSDLRNVINKIQQADNPSDTPTSTVLGDDSLQDTLTAICFEASRIAEAILVKLDGLKLRDTKHRKSETFKQCCKRLWSRDEIKELLDRLSALKEAIDRDVMVSILQNTQEHAIKLSTVYDSLDQQTQRLLTALLKTEQVERSVARDILNAVAQMMSRHGAAEAAEHRHTREMLLQMQAGNSEPLEVTPNVEMLAVPHDQEVRLRSLVNKTILDSLEYPAMSNRYESLLDAFPKTFEWAFEGSIEDQPDWTNLATWLRTGNGIYWISGKPGSGKSTLMKHLCDDERTRLYLDEWARTKEPKDVPLILGTFFFWNSGTLEQRSQFGMLRALLHQIFQQQPDLIPVIFPATWAVQYGKAIDNQVLTYSKPWTLRTLLKAFKQIIGQKHIDVKLFLLIDGMDEFDGDHEILADLFNDITGQARSESSIKVCLSSRPWVIFRDNFGGCPSLQLEAFTHQDIEYYVETRFNASSAFRVLAKMEAQAAKELLWRIVSKADGVFIWVNIVVRDVLRGVRNRDSISELVERVKAFPKDIEPLYAHIMSQIEPSYQIWASKAFQIVHAVRQFGMSWVGKSAVEDPLLLGTMTADNVPQAGCISLAELYFALDETLGAEKVQSMSYEELDEKCSQTELRITARCVCLLEIRQAKGRKRATPKSLVQYFHRTAKDFLEEPSRWERILSWTRNTHFDPYLYMMRYNHLNLHWLSAFEEFDRSQMLDIATRILVIASYADANVASHAEQARILDMANEILNENQIEDNWNASFHKVGIPKHLSSSFLGCALYLNLSGYVSHKLNQHRTIASTVATYMLYRRIVKSRVGDTPGIAYMNLGMASTLLAHGADINYINESSVLERSSWAEFLYQGLPGSSTSHNGNSDFARIMGLFLSSGADANLSLSHSGRSLSLLDFFEDCIQSRYPEQATDIYSQITKVLKPVPAAPAQQVRQPCRIL